MTLTSPIHGLLLDSGATLVHPRGGAWFPGHAFRDVLARHGVDGLIWERLEIALEAGYRHLTSNLAVPTEDAERALFAEYYRRILADLGHVAPAPALLQALASAMVDIPDFEVYADVQPALDDFRARGLRLGIISNAWPSLESKYAQLGLRAYFDSFVISAQHGCIKPDERLFQRGLADLDLAPEDVLFVDDAPDFVQAAMNLGMHGAVMDRAGTTEIVGLPRVTSMAEVTALLA
jgi:putative hydrolase of the HAD superfamily